MLCLVRHLILKRRTRQMDDTRASLKIWPLTSLCTWSTPCQTAFRRTGECNGRHLACVNFLLAHGADPLPIDTAAQGDTALHMACAGAHR